MASDRRNGTKLSDEEALEHAFAKTTSRKRGTPSPANRRMMILIICISVVAVAFATLAVVLFIDSSNQNKVINGNIVVAGVNVNGMTQAEAIRAVSAATANTYKTTPMVVTVLETRRELPASLCRGLNVRAAVKEAYAYSQRNQSGTVNIIPYLSLDTEGIQKELNELGKVYSSTLTQSTYEVTGTAPEQTLVIRLGVPEYGLDLKALYQEVLEGYNRNVFSVEGECGMILPDEIDLAAILGQHYVEPKDATYNSEFEVVEGVSGYGFDLEAAALLLNKANYGDTVEIPFVSIPPEITAEDLKERLFRDELATYTAASTSDTDRDVNLRLACEAINNTVLYPGDVFSYNEALGERTAAKGYRPGNSYVGDKTVTTYGGGICQVSSSLYYCVMVADLEVLVRDAHGFATTYMPLGMDATVSWGSIDFRFRNTTNHPIRIVAESNGGNTTVTILGTDDKEHYIKMEYEVLATYEHGTTYKTMSPDNAEGYRDGDYIVEPYTGYDVKTYRCKYDKTSNELISKDHEATSNYRARDAVICKIDGGSSSGPIGGGNGAPGIGNGGVTEGGELPPELP